MFINQHIEYIKMKARNGHKFCKCECKKLPRDVIFMETLYLVILEYSIFSNFKSGATAKNQHKKNAYYMI
jgi:hypothetical protein